MRPGYPKKRAVPFISGLLCSLPAKVFTHHLPMSTNSSLPVHLPGAYFSGKVKVLIEETYSRSANGGVGYAKAGGNYAGQFYPTQLAIQKGYNQVIWTDDNTHEYIEEAGAMNIFVRIKDTLITGANQ